MDTFDAFEDISGGLAGYNKKSFAVIDKNNEDELLNWLKAESVTIKNANVERLRKIKDNFLRAKNIQYLQQVYQPRDIPDQRKRYMPQITMPLIRDLIDEKTARLMEFRPTVQVVPLHNEESDKAAAKVAKKFLKHVDREHDTERKIKEWIQGSKVAGEYFLVIRWNPDLGEKIGGAGMLESVDGMTAKASMRIGDVELLLASPFDLFIEEAQSYEQVRYGYLFEYVDTDELKLDFPESADFIHSEMKESYFDFTEMTEKSLIGKTLKITFWHKDTKYVPGGFECVYVGNKILKRGPLPYEHGELPFERLVDIINLKELHGEALIEFVRGMASQVNNLNNLVVKQTMLAAHPKWFVDAGSVDDQSLGNDVSIVKVKGGAARPVLAQSNPVSPQLIQQQEMLEQRFYKFGKSNSVVQGEPPTGVNAFVALQYVSESESRRLNPEVIEVSNAVRKMYSKILKVCAQYYKPEDERTLMILGPEGNWEIDDFNPSDLQGPFAVIAQNSSALPDSKAVKTQFLLDLASQFPDVFEREQILEMLGFTQTDRFIDETQRASVSAEAENEAMLESRPIPEPQEYEIHLVHWKAHSKIIQDANFKSNTRPEVQINMLDHLGATEMMMLEQAIVNPGYAQKLLMLPQFPLVYKGPLVQALMPIAPPMPGEALPGAMPEAGAPQMDMMPVPLDPTAPMPPEPVGQEQLI